MTRITRAAIGWTVLCAIWLLVGVINGWYLRGPLLFWIFGLVVVAFIWFVTRGKGAARSS
jgi:hypothetical protein